MPEIKDWLSLRLEIGGALVVQEIGDWWCLGGVGDWRWVVPWWCRRLEMGGAGDSKQSD